MVVNNKKKQTSTSQYNNKTAIFLTLFYFGAIISTVFYTMGNCDYVALFLQTFLMFVTRLNSFLNNN